MALHDVDKIGDQRLAPMPNHSDEVVQRLAHNTTGITNRKDGSANSQRIAFKQGMILTYDSSNRVSSVYGYIPQLADYPVLIVAQPGFDVFVDILNLTAPTV